MRRSDLTARQREVVDSEQRSLLVTGGAGSGKTTVALWAARAELERPSNFGRRALFLTFSRTAVDQIAERSQSAVTPVRDRIEIATFHSFAFRLIRQFGPALGLVDDDPRVQSAAQAKLLGRSSARLAYDDLAPLALKILDHPRMQTLVSRRWCMVICDEFQDTGDQQWQILERLKRYARLLLLGDENQLIYGFLAHSGVGLDRIRNADREVDEVIELESVSHRDPSGSVPALATAVRQRQFGAPSVLQALREERLHVRRGVRDEDLMTAVREGLDAAWSRGSRTFGLFAHTNQGVADLSARLTDERIDHHLVGLPDAEAAALEAMLGITGFSFDQGDWVGVQTMLATYLTACTRGKTPPLARTLASGGVLPPVLARRFEALQESAKLAVSVADAAAVAATAWDGLGISVGQAPWARASPSFLSIVRRAAGGDDPLAVVSKAVEELRTRALFESGRRRPSSVQLMNLHQTKGREADAVLVLCRDDDFHGYEDEPFVEASRLLYVVLTRARREVTMIFGNDPHPLVAPLAELA
ncbi:MAG: UvrD-helicase domain-containing protein [Actinomycetota bacterium]